MVYDINGKALNAETPNCKIIAHRGYHTVAKQNTIPALDAAVENSFTWQEIDIRKCADGIYVLSHDASVTLYNNGSPTPVSIPSSNFSTIKSYTWDSTGNYKLCTLQAAFNSQMVNGTRFICDLKSGTNAEVVELAALCGAEDNIVLSYGSFSAAYSDRELLLKHDNIPIRCIPSDYANYATLASTIGNQIYADVNASDTTHYQQYLNVALSCNIPIMFSGCTTSNTDIWSVLANGVMANQNLNITYNQFLGYLDNDYDRATTITASTSSISIARNGTSTLTGTSNYDAPGGNVYMYSLNPAVAKVTQTAFGKTGTSTITGISAGSTYIRMFDGCGEIKDIPVTVS